MDPLDTESEALKVQVMGREVVLLGPRVAIALSADAAAETARRLAEAAAQATTAAGAQGIEQPSDSEANQASQASSRDA